MKLLNKISSGVFFLVSSIAFGQLEEYSFKRPILNQTETWQEITLPNDVFGDIKSSMADIRIYGITPDNDTLEAPYLLKKNQGKPINKSVEFKIINPSRNANGSYYTLEIPSRETINYLHLNFQEKNFDWLIDLEGSQDQKEWFTLSENNRILSIENDQTSFSYTDLSFSNSNFKYLRIAVKTQEKNQLSSAKINLVEFKETDFRNYALTHFQTENDKLRKETVVKIELTHKVPVANLSLKVEQDYDYYRPIIIQYLHDSTLAPKGWIYAYKTIYTGTLNSFEAQSYSFEPIVAKKFKLIIQNRDNAPLTIESFDAKGNEYSLIARFTEPAAYYLVYGNETAHFPSYDIQNSLSSIPDTLKELNLGKVTFRPTIIPHTREPLFKNKLWLWLIMGAMVLLLGWFSYSMLTKK